MFENFHYKYGLKILKLLLGEKCRGCHSKPDRGENGHTSGASIPCRMRRKEEEAKIGNK
jgi:hypothetical protein